MKALVCAGLLMLAALAHGAADPRSDERVRMLAEEFRCLVCQNQTIADSSAPLAVDLRRQISTQIEAGKSNDDIRAYMVARYGDFVTYRPPLNAVTLLLWAGPFVLLGAGVLVGIRIVRRRAQAGAQARPALTDEERREARRLLQ